MSTLFEQSFQKSHTELMTFFAKDPLHGDKLVSLGQETRLIQ